ncbi:hypothetical protein HY496_02430 [Candidatus Woesearchaeota archaeon]|nr:hypothetical protein [Candidatus Woesearchaeota archaeon]
MVTVPPAAPGFDMNTLYVVVKGLESKVNNLLRQMDIFKNDYIKKNADLKREVKVLTDDLLDLKRDHDGLMQKMDLVVKELRQTAGVEQVSLLRRYVDLWNPIHFATQRDVERIVEAKLAEHHHGGHTVPVPEMKTERR